LFYIQTSYPDAPSGAVAEAAVIATLHESEDEDDDDWESD
jgi:hypothetical protein